MKSLLKLLKHKKGFLKSYPTKPVQTVVSADTNGSNNSGNSKLLKAVEEKINTIMPKKVKILGVKILKIVK